jgi:hypothetical protein
VESDGVTGRVTFERVAVGQGAARALRLIQKRGIELWLMKTINNRLVRCCHLVAL